MNLSTTSFFMPSPYPTAFAREEGKGVKHRRGLCRERRTGQDSIHSYNSRVQCAGGCRASGQRPTQACQFLYGCQLCAVEPLVTTHTLLILSTARAAPSLGGPRPGWLPSPKATMGSLPILKVRVPSGSATCSPCPKMPSPGHPVSHRKCHQQGASA